MKSKKSKVKQGLTPKENKSENTLESGLASQRDKLENKTKASLKTELTPPPR